MRMVQGQRYVRGIAMVEALIYIACLTIFMSVMSVAMWRLWSSQALLNERADGLVKILNVGERWREDVRKSEIIPLELEANGSKGVLLGHQGKRYDYLVEKGELLREADGGTEVLARNIVTSRMVRERSKQGLVYLRWEVEVRLARHGSKTQAFTFTAVPAVQPEKR